MTPPLPLLGASLALAWLLAGAGPAVPVSVQEPDAETVKAFEAIQKEYDAEFSEVRKAVKGLSQEDAGRIFDDFFANVLPDFTARYAELGRAHKGSPVAYDAWSRIVTLSTMSSTRSERGTALLKEALGALTSDHIQSESLAGLASNLRYASETLGEELTVATLEDIAARSPHRAVKASALYTLGGVLGDDKPDGDPRLARAKALFEDLRKNYGDVESYGGRTFGEAAAAYLFALENLVAGKPCPDFAAVDVEGAAFKLSDYKGKVVLVDFWGFW
jgi:hypothetical protein